MQCQEFEHWKIIGEAPSYAVSNLGKVKRIAPGYGTQCGRILKGTRRQRGGYRQVFLGVGATKLPRLVHRLVAEAFIGPRPSALHEVAHCDGNSLNDRANNLRWATHAENMNDASFRKHGTMRSGTSHHRAYINPKIVKCLRKAHATKKRGALAQLAREFGIPYNTAHAAATKKSWNHIH